MQSEHPSASNPPDPTSAQIASDALQRRRLLLKGVGKGAAVASVVVPIQSLAAAEPLVVRLCTVSGVQSNVGSGRTGGTTANCQGYAQSSFLTLSNWPGYIPGPGNSAGSASYTVNGLPYTDATRFNTIFGAGASASNPKMLDLFSSGTASEKIWAAALLSAIKKRDLGLGPSNPVAGYFPYTPEEVLALFGSSRKLAAEAFFRDYLVP